MKKSVINFYEFKLLLCNEAKEKTQSELNIHLVFLTKLLS